MALTQSEITQLLNRWSDGDLDARDELMPLVFDELRRDAARFMAREADRHTLQATALVNEVYLKLVGRRTVQWQSRAQFFAAAAELMRRILVDYARRRKTAKRGRGESPIPLDETIGISVQDDVDHDALHEALGGLAAFSPHQCRLVELRYYFGLTVEETAEVLGVSPTTVKREWRTARLWLRRELSPPECS